MRVWAEIVKSRPTTKLEARKITTNLVLDKVPMTMNIYDDGCHL